MSQSLEERVRAIEQRNARVELDKAWETSWTRKLSIALLTYLIVATFLYYIDNEKPLINALIPVMGFVISTLILNNIRSVWEGKK